MFFVRRYATLESNWDKHKPELSDQENLDAFNSFTPGYPYRTDVDMAEYIPDTCPNKAKVQYKTILHHITSHHITVLITSRVV